MAQMHFLSDSPESNLAPEKVVDTFRRRFSRGMRQRALDELFFETNHLRLLAGADGWKKVASDVRAGVGDITGRDPLSGRCVAKPRGYAGDAATLDIIYGHDDAPFEHAELDSAAASVMACTTNRPASVGVRLRRQMIAETIDACVRRTPGASVLSLACGHLRELELSHAVRNGNLGTVYALDQDEASLDVVSRTYGELGAQPVKVGVRELLKGKRPVAGVDLAYTAGLYDYLPEEVARATTRAMFDMVKPGGTLLIANFHPSLPDIGYMESCMDWWLIYRDESAMAELFSTIDSSEIDDLDVWFDQSGFISYARAKRK